MALVADRQQQVDDDANEAELVASFLRTRIRENGQALLPGPSSQRAAATTQEARTAAVMASLDKLNTEVEAIVRAAFAEAGYCRNRKNGDVKMPRTAEIEILETKPKTKRASSNGTKRATSNGRSAPVK